MISRALSGWVVRVMGGRSDGVNNKLLVKKKSYPNDLHVSNYKLGFDDWMPRQSHLEV